MARDTGSIVKMSRREGYALHPKAHKALVKRSTPPGQAANGRFRGGKGSQYLLQLREKQKVKRLYGLLEKQFSNLMKEATRMQGQSGSILLQPPPLRRRGPPLPRSTLLSWKEGRFRWFWAGWAPCRR